MTIRTLIVDDEEPARELLRAFLVRWPEVSIVGEAGDGDSAVTLATALTPDLVFLDVQMPGMNGFDVLAALAAVDRSRPPLVVFVTAYEEYALRAFEASACDYLLKPFDAERLANTMRRVLDRQSDPGRALRALLEQVTVVPSKQVVVKVDGRHLFLDPDDIEWIEAVGKDVRLHLDGRDLLVRESMTSLCERLDGARFVRVHRSAIVNRGRIREMQPWFKGDYVIITRGGARIVSGRTYRDEVRRLIDPAASMR